MLPFSEQFKALQHVYEGALLDRHKESSYVDQDDLLQEKTADFEPWTPSEAILNYVKNFHEIKIELVRESTNLKEIERRFRDNGDVGLILMGRCISRHDRPALIVLSTQDRIYAIDPYDEQRGIRFLKNQIENKNSQVNFWTTNGLAEARCLKENYGIKLYGSRAKCCTALHINLMKVLSALPKRAHNTFKCYPKTAMEEARKPPRLESFERLVYIWLNVDKSDYSYDVTQLVHLHRRPLVKLTLTAKNLIMKRCILVRMLASSLLFYSDIEFNIMNQRMMKCLTSFSDSETRKVLEEAMNKSREHRVPTIQYFSHMDFNQ